MNYGLELLERLPRLGAVFAAGEIDFRIVAAAVFRTGLMRDPDVLAKIDTALATRVGRWNTLSRKRLAALIDGWVAHFDPAAVRNARSAEQDRHIEFGESRDGMVEFWGAMRATDAAVLDRALDGLADAVCATDPRTKRQRRADALAALAEGSANLACDCGVSDCPTAGAPPKGPFVIHLIADASTLSENSATPGYLPGYGIVPPAMLRELAKRARLRPLIPPALLCAEPRYRPSTALAEFIRCRDLVCRFPGCDKPAEVCDIDHTVPWHADGPTHPSNLALLCRAHHLLKTFWAGENGWAERQYADGSITWTSPSGRTYTTKPGGALFFPALAEPTGEVTPQAGRASAHPGRRLMMPVRQRPRAEERAARIQWERSLNEARWAADPPPF
jgi:hypothetical protein